MGTALDVAREQLDAGEQATHAAHVIVAVAAHFIRDAVQNQHAVFERLQRRHNFLELEILAGLLGPIGRRDGAVRGEHDHQPLARPGRTGQAQAGQAHQERQRGSGQAQVLDKFSAMHGVHDATHKPVSPVLQGECFSPFARRASAVEKS